MTRRSEPKPIAYDVRNARDQAGLEPIPEVPPRKGEDALAEWLAAFEEAGPNIQPIR